MKNSRIVLFVLLLCSVPVFAQTPWTGVLSGSRAANWSQAGVVGGIPSASWTQCTNSQCQTVTSAGTSATAAQILAALQNAPSDTYVLLGPGTYHLSTGICVSGANNVELRGSGANSTFLVFSGSAGCMGGAGGALLGFQSSDGTYPEGVTPSQVAPWSGGSQGATSIVFPNGLGPLSVTPNKTLLMLDQCNTGFSGNSTTGSGGTGNNGVPCPNNNANNSNPSLAVDNGQFFNCNTEYGESSNDTFYGCAFQGADTFDRYERGQLEIVQVTSCNPGCNATGSVTVNITPGLIHPNWSSAQSPEAWVVQPSQYVGFKDLSIDGSAASGSSSVEGIGFSNATNVWVQRVRILSPYQIGIWMSSVSHASILDNYIYNVGQNYAYQDSWGIKDGPGEANLFQNNIVQATRVAIANGEGSATGDVTAYNFAVNQIDQSDYVWGAYWQHANGDDYNLYEGNVGTYINEDDVHGTHDFITMFRNLFTGWESCANGNCGSYTQKDAGTSAIQDMAYNRYANIVGNVLGDGTPFLTSSAYQYQFINNEYYANTLSPYNMGSGNYANGTSPQLQIPADNLTVTSAVRWGNYDLFNNATLFCTGSGSPTSNCVEDERAETATESPVYEGLSNPSTTLPASFYLSGQPSWWPSSIPYPAVGPDVFGGNLGQCNGPVNAAGKFNGLLVLESSQCAGSGLNAGWAGGHANAIPAMACYLNVMEGPPDGVGNALTFNPAACYGSEPPTQAATPTFSPSGGTYSSAQSVTISDSTPEATIYYTTNGTTPTTGSSVYSSPISVSSSETIEAIATASGYSQSATGSAVYTINLAPQAATPAFSPGGGTYSAAQNVTISDATSGATIYYTTNGTTPTTGSSVYSSPINVSTSETLQAIAVASGYTQSATASATYTIGGTGTISLVQEKVLSNNGGQIVCNPTCPAMTVNSTGAGDLLLISAVATGNGGGTQTNIASIACSSSCGTWVLPGAVCQQYSANTGGVDCGYVLSSTAGATSVTVTMSANTPYGTVYFREYHTTQPAGFRFDTVQTALNSGCTSCATPTLTLSGQNDVLIASGAPQGGFTGIGTPYGDVQTESYTLTALGDHLNTSSGAGATIAQNADDAATLYTIAFTDTPPVLPSPTFSPTAGTYTGTQSVTISDSVSGTTIYYTTNGTTPTTSSPVYSGPISVSSSETLEAIATKTGYTQSTAATAAYTINLPQAAMPAFSPAGGSYSSAQSVTISDASSGTTIYYTTNGTTPTTSSSVYSSSINVSSSETLEAMAMGGGYTQSATASATYTIAAGSISLVQEKVLSNNGGQIVCNPTCPAITVNSTGAGDLLFVSAVATGNGGGTQTNIASISCSSSCGTWVLPGAVCQKYSASTGGVDCGYVLSSAAGATTVTVTMSGNTPYGTVYFREYHTTQPSGFRFDTVQTSLNSGCTSCATPSLTLSGKNDVLIASGAPGGGFTSISAPYADVQTESYTVTALGDRLNTSSGTGATITQNANNPAALYTIAFTDTPAAQLSGTVSSSSAAVTLSSGTTSWAFFDGYDTNASGGAEVNNVTVAGGSDGTYGNDARSFSWTGGTPTSSSTNNTAGLYLSATNGSFTFTVPASTTLQTVKVYVGGSNSGGTLTATLSDNSASAYSDSSLSSSGGYDGVYTLNYAAASAGQTLTIKWTQSSGNGNINVQAASITVP